MNTELAQFHDGFFAESFEALDSMEQALLHLVPGAADRETIHTIFRLAHSIKSSASMLDFNAVATFTHAVESLLDELRAGRLQVTASVCDALLQAVDQLRALLVAMQLQQPLDLVAAEVLQSRLTAMTSAADLPVWRIRFTPHADLLRRGFDSRQLFAELGGMGALGVQADGSGWVLTLATSVPRDSIGLIFECVEGGCDLSIEKMTPTPAARPPVASVSTVPATPADTENTVRVPTIKLDALLQAAVEAATTQSSLSSLVSALEGPQANRLRAELAALDSRLRDLQDSVLRVRMQPVASLFNRLPRLVHDLSARLGKQVRLEISGEKTELDKAVLERIGDPLVHLVRNSIDHGIEAPALRLAAGKSAEGTIQLHAAVAEDAVHIVIRDDGRGLDVRRLLRRARHSGLVDTTAELSDEQVHQLIFLPGLSTADQATEISGRGVGMDVVRRNTEQLGGSVDVHSEPGLGTTIRIILPLSTVISARSCA